MKSHITNNQCHNRGFRDGFTIIELLASITIIGILTAIIIPAVQQAREAGRLAMCKNNMRQIGVAIHNFESERRVIPPLSGGGFWGSYLVHILPQMEQPAMYDRFRLAKTFDESQKLGSLMVQSYVCPSDSVGDRLLFNFHATNYAGNYGTGLQKFGYNGFFQPDSSTSHNVGGPLRFADIQDGLSNTVAVAEILSANGTFDESRTIFPTPEFLNRPDQLEQFASVCANLSIKGLRGLRTERGRPWSSSDIMSSYYNHILTPNQKNCLNKNSPLNGAMTSSSSHSGGVNVLLADGSVDFVSEGIDLANWRNLGSRNGD